MVLLNRTAALKPTCVAAVERGQRSWEEHPCFQEGALGNGAIKAPANLLLQGILIAAETSVLEKCSLLTMRV